MNCPNEQDLHRLADGELSFEAASLVESHVASCPDCAVRVAEVRMLGDMLRGAPLPVPAIDAMKRWQRSMISIQERSVRRLASWLTAAASIVLAGALYVAMSSTAQADPVALADWETAVIGTDSQSQDVATANWITADLSRNSGEAKP